MQQMETNTENHNQPKYRVMEAKVIQAQVLLSIPLYAWFSVTASLCPM